MKKLKDNIPFIINIIIIIVPFLLVNNWVFKSLELNIHEGLKFSLSGIITFGFFAISLGIHTIIHEFGHLVTGLISGYKYVFFRIWKYTFVKDESGIKIKNFHIPGSLGQCLMAPPKKKNGKYPFLFYNLGGIIFNVVFALIGITIILFTNINLITSYLFSFVLVGFYLAATNAYPFGYIPNDGTNIQSLLRSDDSKKAFYNALLLNELTVKNKVTKRELKKFVSKSLYKDFKEPVVQGVVSENVSILIEENKLLEALNLANFLLKQKNMSIILRDLIRLDKMAIFLLLGDKTGINSLMKNKDFFKSFNSKGQADIERLRYMYYSLHEKDDKKAKLALKNFNNLFENQLMNSNISYDKKLIEYTDIRRNWEDSMEKLDSIPSTNDYLKEKIEEGYNIESVIAKKQTKGKGQRNKEYYSPEGGLYLSMKVKPDISNLKYLTARTGILVVESINKALRKNVQLKWLNDLIYKDKKIGGILTETKFSSSGELEYVIIGIGINLKNTEENIPEFIEEIFGTLEVKNIDYVISAILYYLMPNLKTLEKPINIPEFQKKYNKYLYNKNKEVFIKRDEEIIKGKLVGIDKDINLLLKIDDTTEVFSYKDTRVLYNYMEVEEKEIDE